MPHIESIVRNHIKKKIKINCKKTDESCNWRKKEPRPLKGRKCRKTNSIYKAKTIPQNHFNTYVGLCSNEIKKEMPATIPPSIVNRIIKKVTESSKLLHRLNKTNINIKLNWKDLKCESESRHGVGTCRLWLEEALLILESNDCINKTTKLMNTCRQMSKFLLKNWRSDLT